MNSGTQKEWFQRVLRINNKGKIFDQTHLKKLILYKQKIVSNRQNVAIVLDSKLDKKLLQIENDILTNFKIKYDLKEIMLLHNTFADREQSMKQQQIKLGYMPIQQKLKNDPPPRYSYQAPKQQDKSRNTKSYSVQSNYQQPIPSVKQISQNELNFTPSCTQKSSFKKIWSHKPKRVLKQKYFGNQSHQIIEPDNILESNSKHTASKLRQQLSKIRMSLNKTVSISPRIYTNKFVLTSQSQHQYEIARKQSVSKVKEQSMDKLVTNVVPMRDPNMDKIERRDYLSDMNPEQTGIIKLPSRTNKLKMNLLNKLVPIEKIEPWIVNLSQYSEIEFQNQKFNFDI